MTNRRDAIARLGSISIGALLSTPGAGLIRSIAASTEQWAFQDDAPSLAPGAPTSPERLALIESFRKSSAGIDAAFEMRTYRGDWAMPYRLFRAEARGRLPLVVYLHGSGGLGTDNIKQMGLGNVFGTRVWALPDAQSARPCHVLAPQTDRGWIRYADPAPGDSVARPVAGLGDGARAVFGIIDALRKELDVDDRRIYLTGQSMGGGGVWHMTAHRPGFFAAAVTCCGSATQESPERSAATPVWNFHGIDDRTVPLDVSRDRIAALRKAGARPLHTEYAGVGHNVWEWAYTEPQLAPWLFAQRRRA
jgi:predicted peptidase